MTPKSIEAIYRDNCKMVYWAAYSVLKRESDAMDIAQSVFLRAIKNIDKLNTMEDGQVKAWLYRVAVNLCYDAGRRLKREIPAEELPEPNTDREYELPEASAISRDQRERVKRAIDALPDIYRETVMLHYYSERSVREIAQATGVTEGTVKSRIFRAKERLYELLKEGEKND